jgi:hypothetical protein
MSKARKPDPYQNLQYDTIPTVSFRWSISVLQLCVRSCWLTGDCDSVEGPSLFIEYADRQQTTRGLIGRKTISELMGSDAQIARRQDVRARPAELNAVSDTRLGGNIVEATKAWHQQTTVSVFHGKLENCSMVRPNDGNAYRIRDVLDAPQTKSETTTGKTYRPS